MTKPKSAGGGEWKRTFLAALAETSNVARAAKSAGIAASTVYDARRKNRGFARAWQTALAEGYDNLEMELLGRLRDGEIKRAAGAKTGVRTFDNAIAFRLLAVHREARDKERAGQANVSAADVRASIERRIEALRQRVLADKEAQSVKRSVPMGEQHWLLKAEPHRIAAFAKSLKPAERQEYDYTFSATAHPGQLPPPGEWRTWLILAGRGFGKTRAGAEWVRNIADGDADARIALVGASLGEARSVMVEGPSGVLACCPPHARPQYEPSLRRVSFANGALALLYGANEPESLRGPQHSHAWCDEIGKWSDANGRAGKAWDNLLLGLRLGSDPRVVATTTPRAVPLLRRVLAGEGVATTRGRTADNGHLPARFRRAMQAEFGRSLLARQELDGELIEDIEGALWNRELLEACREAIPTADAARLVIGVDPPASSGGDACGIVVCALGQDGIGRVLADCSVRKATPERWARAVATAARVWRADRVVAEANQGGEMVRSVLRAADVALPVKLVHASRGKSARAEPVAALYEAGRVRHIGQFPELEDQLCGLLAGGRYEGPGRSPDRADALVWALTELMLGRKWEPRVWRV